MSLRVASGGCLVLLIAVVVAPPPARADIFTYKDETGTQVVEARLAGTGQAFMALELSDGQYRVISERAIERREVKDGPAPLDGEAIAGQLRERFGDDRFRSLVKEPFVMGLVLGTQLPKNSESRVKGFLQRAATFMKNVEAAFGSFVKEMKIPVQSPTHPLVVLIFETEEDFEKYADSVTGGRGMSAQRMAGFYSGMTNHLAIRLAECRTFEVPLHEAIHQQVYNRNVFQRLAPVPHWFDEGIATGFEGNQGKVNIGPTKISARYARQVLAAKNLSFGQIMADDDGFRGDVLAGEAYGYAWGLHWLMVTKYRTQYPKYVRLLAEKSPLAKQTAEERLSDFRDVFGKAPDEVTKDFRPYLDTGIRRQKVVLNPEKPAGISQTHENVGEVELTAVSRIDEGGRMEVEGKLTNTSPIRAMAYYVTVETDAGTYADWHIPNLDVQKTAPLPKQIVVKAMRGAPAAGRASKFRVHIRSTPVDSAEAAEWKKGKLPEPQA